jgi:hypothetical protein
MSVDMNVFSDRKKWVFRAIAMSLRSTVTSVSMTSPCQHDEITHLEALVAAYPICQNSGITFSSAIPEYGTATGAERSRGHIMILIPALRQSYYRMPIGTMVLHVIAILN